MKRIINRKFPLMFSLALSLFSCSNEDFLTTQSDETKVVSFSIGTDMPQVVSKARDGYRGWTTGDPTSFGAFGIYNRNMTTKLFDNQQVNRVGSAWTYTPLKYWADYTWCETFDFFGYMPYKEEGVSFTQGTGADENKYTLSFPVTLEEGVVGTVATVELSDGVIDNVADVPLICHEPVHKTVVGDVINYQMDQVLTGFTLKFMLGEKMTQIRDFVIKEVKIKGAANEMPYSGTVSRTYTYDPSKDSWTSGDVTWTGVTKKTEATTFAVPFVDHGNGSATDAYDSTAKTLRLGYSFPNAISQWGNPFYAIPSMSFNPTIEVKYDVTVKDENDTYITTRSDIVSTIKFKDDNFTTYTAAGAVAKVNPIVVQIVPNYLYVLADADQRNGYLIVEE